MKGSVQQGMRIGVVGLITIGGESSGTSGGVEKLIEEVSLRLAARGHEVTVYCRARYNREGLTDYKGVHIRNLPAVYTKHLEAITHSFLSMCCAIKDCEVIQFHSMGPALLSFIPRLFGRKTVCTLHGLDWRRNKWGGLAKHVLRLGEWCALRFPHRTTVVSRFLERYYRERFGKEVCYIPNGVSHVQTRPLDRLRRFGLEQGRYILYLSRIVPEKGVHYLIPAFRALDTNMKLVVVGDARHAADYYSRVRTMAAGDARIVFTGPLYGEEKEEVYSNAYLFCLPSDVEGLPIVLLEAMGAGCCCLTSDIPELVEVVDPARLGYDQGGAAPSGPYGETFVKGNVDDLREKLRSLIDAPERRADLGRRGRQHAVSAYSWDRIALQYEELYRSLLRTSPTVLEGGASRR
jgi:glycosyltransferase involved in cell wall biosynthesis